MQTPPTPTAGSGGTCPDAPACNPDLQVDPTGPALIVTDPQVLAEVSLQRMAESIGATFHPPSLPKRSFSASSTR
ncbi:MAG: hypothetical protein R3F14_14770 [Polyangiaceae bacterium]